MTPELDRFMTKYCDMRWNGVDDPTKDEVYTHETQGSFNITRLAAEIAQFDIQPTLIAVSPDMIEANRNADCSPARIASMPNELPFQKPVIFLQMTDETFIVGDGNHRLRKLILMGAKEVPAFLVPKEVVDRFRVTIEFQRRDTGEWMVDDEAFLAAASGQFPHHARY